MADFALDLLKLTPLEESIVMSPLSLVAALSVLERGAGGVTQSQIVDALKRKSNGDVPELIRKLAEADGVAMSVATKFFLANDLQIAEQYNDTITKDFNVTADRLDFKDQALTVNTVNSFVSEATREMIPNLLSNDFYQPDMRAFLVNAVYFKGQWATRFEPDCTQEDTFHGINGDRKESFMALPALKDCRFTIAHGTQILALPYKDKDYEFVIFLPLESVTFEEFRANLTGAIMKELLDIAEREPAGVNVTIPKFKTSSQPEMKQMLQRLGISQLFECGCDLKGVCEHEDIYVEDVIHKAVVEVTEEGTEAAAATGAVMMTRSMPINPDFFADHPFVYGIFRGEEPIFIGQYC
ncbi:serine proteinase inhibitor [Ancylostoma caninum]|uniref:Serine proteinase inhibitor n=1 Tax=Ancylostoma caninum TaxID=29170 RepID=A0A368GM02_ANCCA|nr:serine proteinase inhibitor [Ancylostoma caninum]